MNQTTRTSHGIPVLGLQTRLTLAIAAVAALLGLWLGWYWGMRAEIDLTAALAARQARTGALAASGFAGPIWNVDHAAIVELLDALFADPEVQDVEISATGVPQNELARHRQREVSNPMVLEVPIVNSLAGTADGGRIGLLRLSYTREFVDDAVARTRRDIALLLIAMLVAVVGVSAALIDRWVRRPVARLGAAAERVAGGDLGATLPIERKDEIGVLTSRFNAMSRQLQRSAQVQRDSEARYRSLFENA
ncbi:MAG TPA: HAMP domain-containing protein, partial [Burkholderiaceae bacterium]